MALCTATRMRLVCLSFLVACTPSRDTCPRPLELWIFERRILASLLFSQTCLTACTPVVATCMQPYVHIPLCTYIYMLYISMYVIHAVFNYTLPSCPELSYFVCGLYMYVLALSWTPAPGNTCMRCTHGHEYIHCMWPTSDIGNRILTVSSNPPHKQRRQSASVVLVV